MLKKNIEKLDIFVKVFYIKFLLSNYLCYFIIKHFIPVIL